MPTDLLGWLAALLLVVVLLLGFGLPVAHYLGWIDATALPGHRARR